VVLTQLREAGLPLLILPAEPNVAGAESKIRGVAGALGLESQGEVLVRTVRSRVERALAGIPGGAGPRVLFLMGLRQGAPIAAGAGTSAHAMIELAGGTNVLTDFSGYRPVSPEALAQARPEVLLVPESASERAVLFDLRLPRVALGCLVGAALGVSGTALQGLFRNPLADPGLLGIASGAALCAVLVIVLGDELGFTGLMGLYALPVAAFLGGLGVTLVVYRLAQG
jgi:ABC-type Fe3+-siderophore transport system permease subunit